jgi:D-alanyl-D-alanine carboxypeptidase
MRTSSLAWVTTSGGVAPTTDRRLLALLATAQADGRLPSVVGGAVRDGQPVWSGAWGELSGPDVQYRIGSITKTMTAVLVLQLRDEGRLRLSDPLASVLGEVPYGDRTIRSLLSHSSGMSSEPPGQWWERSAGVGFDDLVAAVRPALAPFEPGSTYHYSNLAFALLGQVVAQLCGRGWWECVVERILRPLGMTRTSYLAEPPAATGWSVHPFAGTLSEEPATDTGAMAPAGQVWSTVTDLGRYAGLLLGEHPDLLAPGTLDEMCTPQSGSLAGGVTGGYGLGLRLLAGGSGTLVGHTGSMPGFQAGLFADRRRRTAGAVLANGTVGLAAEQLVARLLSVLEEAEPTLAPPWRPVVDVPHAVADVLGVWHWGNTAHVVTWDGNRLVMRLLDSGDERDTFALRDDGTLVGTAGYHHGETLDVVRRPDGTVSHLVCATFLYARTPYDPDVTSPG